MDAVRKDVESLVQKELDAANKKFPLFNSPHEGYAVILEEVDELKDDIAKIEQDMPVLWRVVKGNEVNEDQGKVFIRSIKIRAILAAVEAIQAAAMCDKFQMSFEMDSKNSIEGG